MTVSKKTPKQAPKVEPPKTVYAPDNDPAALGKDYKPKK